MIRRGLFGAETDCDRAEIWETCVSDRLIFGPYRHETCDFCRTSARATLALRRSATLAYRLSGHWLTVRWLGVDAAPKPYAEYSVGLAFLYL